MCYCSKECQVKDWQDHKVLCKKLPEIDAIAKKVKADEKKRAKAEAKMKGKAGAKAKAKSEAKAKAGEGKENEEPTFGDCHATRGGGCCGDHTRPDCHGEQQKGAGCHGDHPRPKAATGKTKKKAASKGAEPVIKPARFGAGAKINYATYAEYAAKAKLAAETGSSDGKARCNAKQAPACQDAKPGPTHSGMK